MEHKLSADDIDLLSEEEFMDYFGEVIEHGSDYVMKVYSQRPFKTIDDFIDCFDTVLDNTSLEEKEEILQRHPQLGTKNKMTRQSTNEQERAGIQKLPHHEAMEMEELNESYIEKFGFTFVVCVLDKNPKEILNCLKKRLENDRMTEIDIGIDEVKKIVKVRLLSIIQNN